MWDAVGFKVVFFLIVRFLAKGGDNLTLDPPGDMCWLCIGSAVLLLPARRGAQRIRCVPTLVVVSVV